MFERAERNGKMLSFLIIWTLAMGGLFAAIAAMSPVSQAGTCDQVGGVITGDWTITTPQVCSGIVYTVKGSININSGGSLTLLNGGLSFAKDTSHQGYSLNVNAGGALVLDNSIVTTQTVAIAPYLKLGLTVSGANSQFTMVRGAILKFPGSFNAVGANINISDSKITGFVDSELQGLGINVDDNNDGPLISWASTAASLYRSQIDRIYEFSGGTAGNIQLTGGTSFYAYDSHIGVDYASTAITPGLHNELHVDGTSNAYLYNVTIDRSQDPVNRADWLPAFVPTAAGGNVYLLRWLHLTVVDSGNLPVKGAAVWSTVSPTATTAQYPDNGLSTTPSSQTLWYLGRSATGPNAWNATDSNGAALIPLYTDQITTATLPNAASFGDYHQVVTYAASTISGGIAFKPYPAVSQADNNIAVTMSFANLQVCPTSVTTWSFNRQIVGTVSVSSCLEISGAVTITSGGLYVNQGSAGRNRSYVKILSGGSLTLMNSVVWSNFALPFFVANGAALVTSGGTALNLSAGASSGLLREDGATSIVSLTDTTVNANVTLNGGSATLVRDTFLGPALSINTVQKTNLWDATLTGVTSLSIRTDDGNPATVDVDIRNTTFNPVQTSQLVFGGSQNVQLTSVQLYDPSGTWWTTMITGGASVSRYWWVWVNALDGSGTLVYQAMTNLTLQRLDPNLLMPFTVPNPAAGDLYLASGTTWPISAPRAYILYRAFSETRTTSTRLANNSYIATGTVFLGGTTYNPDANQQRIVTANTMMNLTFRVNLQNQPDLALLQSDYPRTVNVTQNTRFNVNVVIHNLGRTTATGVTVAAYLNGNRSLLVGRIDGITVGVGAAVSRSMNISAISLAGTQVIELIADPFNQINEGSAAKKANNFANITLNVQPPAGFVVVATPTSGQAFGPGDTISVTGYARDQTANGISGLPLTVQLRSGTTNLSSNTTVSQDAGFFVTTITVPRDVADGSYNIVVTPGSGLVTPSTSSITVKRAVPFLSQPVPILGLPFWLFFIILAAVAAIAIGVTLYWKVYGLGKMVECGECGAFIPEDSTTCPKCGVEFEKDMAKCSNCQAWIPVDVKQCPECGVEFATGEVEMADYQEKMRLQYDEVVGKFKEEAGRQLGRTLSDREFQEWWRKQPTFLTFEDWLREEEEMRKMGSKPCPTCGTLNSVTATVCHKCGSLMREAPRPPSGGTVAAPPARKSSPPAPPAPEGQASSQGSPYGPPGAGGAQGTDAIPRRVIRKPVAPQPVVQKKVIKKPMDGTEDGEGTEGQSTGDSKEDEL